MSHQVQEEGRGVGRQGVALVLVLVAALLLVVAAQFITDNLGGDDPVSVATTTRTSTTLFAATTEPPGTVATTTAPTTSTTSTTVVRPPNVIPAGTVGRPWGSVKGLTMFRGNPTRTWYGTGPIPQEEPAVDWRYPETGGLCGDSSVGGETTTWCGSGWTGQPVVWERPDGVTEVIFGAYDKSIHFLDAETGERTREPFLTGDIIKGSVTLDPDGYPILYSGSRDGEFHVIALDRDVPEELWSLPATVVDGIWNDDFDGNAVIIDDILYEGGENGWFFAIRLNRGTDSDGKVVVDPEILDTFPGYTQEMVTELGNNQSIENSVAVFGQTVYFANSGGRVVGMDVSDVSSGETEVVFDYWVGDDVDASIVIDRDGMLYVSVEEERKNERSAEVGQLVKLDPSKPDDPRVWGVRVPGKGGDDGGLWATPALGDGVLYAATHPGDLMAVDTETGEELWSDELGWHAWSSPVLVGDTLVVATCTGALQAYDITEPTQPEPLWTAQVSESCIESTPAVWKGRMYVGSRDGGFYAIAPGRSASPGSTPSS
ncbi:MAG: PQQ-binding-like beta-propeller repeat protein [Acidimicrobiia bacterium]|nr:PQQ-binding-like beta-propeller repeat protein [Acidimicrobiia bacterium]